MTGNSTANRTRWAAVGAAVAIAVGAVGIGGLNIASADVSSGDRPVFIPIDPCRLMDTRGGAPVGPRSTPIGAGEALTVAAHGSNGECTGASAIPADAVALALNVTAVGASASTFLTFWGDGANPGTSNLNPRPGAAPTPNSVNTPLSTSGNFNVYNDAGTVNVIADVNGYYAPHDHDDRYYTKDEIDAARPDEIYINSAEFEVFDAATGPSRPFGVAVAASGDCLSAPLPLTAEMTIESVDVTLQTTDPSEAGVLVFGLLNEPGEGLALDDILDPLGEYSNTATSGDPADLHSTTWVPTDANVEPERFTYQIVACPGAASGGLSVVGATIHVSYP